MSTYKLGLTRKQLIAAAKEGRIGTVLAVALEKAGVPLCPGCKDRQEMADRIGQAALKLFKVKNG